MKFWNWKLDPAQAGDLLLLIGLLIILLSTAGASYPGELPKPEGGVAQVACK